MEMLQCGATEGNEMLGWRSPDKREGQWSEMFECRATGGMRCWDGGVLRREKVNGLRCLSVGQQGGQDAEMEES